MTTLASFFNRVKEVGTKTILKKMHTESGVIANFINPGEAPFSGLKSKSENFHISLPYVP